MQNKQARLNSLVQLATKFDRLGLHVLANKVDKLLESEVNNIDAILSIYKDLHSVTAEQRDVITRKVIGVLRKEERPDTPRCPFGLPIPLACQFAGASVEQMSPRAVEHSHNKRVYNKARDHKQCPYALQVLKEKKAVHCSYGTVNAEEAYFGLYGSSPMYPKLWQGFNIPDPLVQNSNYYTYHDFHYYSLY